MRLLLLFSPLFGCLPELPEGDSGFVDADGDGVSATADCDDSDGSVGAARPWYADADDDGFGDPAALSAEVGCPGDAPPAGYVTDNTDCDDALAGVNPAATETWYDGVDQDCDADDCDQDADGFCWDAYTFALPEGKAEGDCDDQDPAANPAATETWYDGLDQDCDGGSDYDADGDGVDAAAWGEDCDDSDATRYGGATETCDDGVDQDCDGDDAPCVAFDDYSTVFGSVMVAIAAGTFTMGGGASDAGDAYQDHEVTLTRDFWIGETEVTRAAWEAWSGALGWAYSGYPCTSATAELCPTDSVSWAEVALYANALSSAEGLASCYRSDGGDLATDYLADPASCPGYRLPTEAEWEYAARAGEDTVYAGSDDVTEVAWYTGNASSLGTYSHEVATLAPNAWGLYDMTGNEWEWVGDWYDAAYYNSSPQADPAGPESGASRSFRGGSWGNLAQDITVSSRSYDYPNRYAFVGFRLCRTAP